MSSLFLTICEFFAGLFSKIVDFWLALKADHAFGIVGTLIPIGLFFLFPLAVWVYYKIKKFYYKIKKRDSEDQRLTRYWRWCISTALAVFFWFIPFFWTADATDSGVLKCIRVFFASVQGVIRVFAVDDFSELYEVIGDLGCCAPVLQSYTFLGIFLYLFAPILTFGLILSIFKNIFAYIRYNLSGARNVHIFSELNEKSLALAKSISDKKKNPFVKDPRIIFADILDKNEEEHLDLVAAARDINAILFRQDITAIRFRKWNWRHAFKYFYLISDDESEKIAHMEYLISRYCNVKNTKLYVFSDEEESKCFLDSYPDDEKREMLLDVIRVNDIRSLIYHNLDKNGLRLFEHSVKCENSEERIIHAAVVGFGKYGKEMIKALLWYTQLPGYRLKLTVFDEKEDQSDAKEEFKGMCPAINVIEEDKKENETAPAQTPENDMRYEIRFVACKEGTAEFYEKLGKLEDLTYVFVALGKDSLNISATMGIRDFLTKCKMFPDIETVVYDSKLKERIGADWDNDYSEMITKCNEKLEKIEAELKNLQCPENTEFGKTIREKTETLRDSFEEIKALFQRNVNFSDGVRCNFNQAMKAVKDLLGSCNEQLRPAKEFDDLCRNICAEFQQADKKRKAYKKDFDKKKSKYNRVNAFIRKFEKFLPAVKKLQANCPQLPKWNFGEIEKQHKYRIDALIRKFEKFLPAAKKLQADCPQLQQWNFGKIEKQHKAILKKIEEARDMVFAKDTLEGNDIQSWKEKTEQIQKEAKALCECLELDSAIENSLREISKCAKEIKNYLVRPYKEIHYVHVIGDLDTFYSDDTVIGSDLIEDGASIHYRYCYAVTDKDKAAANKTFYMDDYNFFSSVAKALHARLRAKILQKLTTEWEERKKKVENPQTVPTKQAEKQEVSKENTDTETREKAKESEKLPTYSELFYAFVPENPEKLNFQASQHDCNYFILKHTGSTDEATDLCDQITNFQECLDLEKKEKSLQDELGKVLPFRSPQVTERIKKAQCKCGEYTLGFSDLMELAISTARIEHVRWNAYMRSEGYSYINKDNFKKDWDRPLNLHGDIKPSEELSFKDIIKDI